MSNRATNDALIIGLICPFTQDARGRQSGLVQALPSEMIADLSCCHVIPETWV